MPLHHIVLLGLMGSGKTTVGVLLANRLGWTLRDSDADLQATSGRSAREVAATDGIDRLHAREVEHLLTALEAPGPSVIAAAAFVIDMPAVRQRLQDPSILVAWLQIDAALASARVTTATHRPMPEALDAQAERRDPWFASVADVVVDVATAAPEAVADAVAAVAEGERDRSAPEKARS